jgi:hypothetical protein
MVRWVSQQRTKGFIIQAATYVSDKEVWYVVMGLPTHPLDQIVHVEPVWDEVRGQTHKYHNKVLANHIAVLKHAPSYLWARNWKISVSTCDTTCSAIKYKLRHPNVVK